MANPKGLESVVSQLKEQRTNFVNQLKHVDAALAVLSKLDGGRSYTTPRRTMSASARKKIAAAQKARWAKVKGHQKVVPIQRVPRLANERCHRRLVARSRRLNEQGGLNSRRQPRNSRAT